MGGAADKLVESAAAGAEALNAVPADSVAGPTRQADIPHQPRKARRKEDIIIQFQAGASRHLGFIQRKGLQYTQARAVPDSAVGRQSKAPTRSPKPGPSPIRHLPTGRP
ncbi:hypothetical protein CGC21_16455 [Leishmania donovani]|uniref:Uncharacterized protein n=1 Tax=Leishmania donovani TaxID=5661 RepID=A0A504XUI0_LEIDO|nr:hypothetical protein CGC21_16455 [Leishmania donovani]